MYKLIIRPILFWFDPEEVHYFTFSLIRFVSKIPGFTWIFKSLYLVNDKRLEREVFGLKFKNPVGLAAGFDKDAKLVDELARIGAFFLPNSGSSSSSSSATSQAIDLTQLTSLYESLNIELLQAIKKNTDDMVFLLKAIAE